MGLFLQTTEVFCSAFSLVSEKCWHPPALQPASEALTGVSDRESCFMAKSWTFPPAENSEALGQERCQQDTRNI